MSLLNPIRVVLADDHAMVRESLARVLDSVDEISVIGTAGDGLELKSIVAQLQPDALVMDYSMPDHNAASTIRDLKTEFRSLKILVLTVHENVHYAVRTLREGAHGYLIKSAAVEELVTAIQTIQGGDVYISKKLSPDVWAQLRRPQGKHEGVEGLSQREFDVLRMIGGGASLQDCARQLGISVSTVSTYRGRVIEKLNLTTTNDLVRFAVENNLANQ